MATPPVFVAGQVLTAAQMNQIGLWAVKTETAFTSATTVNIDNVFTSDFTNYRINIVATGSVATAGSLQLRVGGVNATTNYNVQVMELAATTTFSGFFNTAQTTFQFASFGVTQGAVAIDVYRPAIAAQTNFACNNSYSGATAATPGIILRNGNHSTATAYDGLSLIFTSATTGTYTIYGYTK